MSFEVEFTEVASDDLADIKGYISGDNPEAAERITNELLRLATSLSLNPFMGRITPEYQDPSIRDIVYGKYRIVYFVNESAQMIQILRFWHGARGYLP